MASRIAIIGRNGSEKTTLLNLLVGGTIEPTSDRIVVPPNVVIDYVPQWWKIFLHKAGMSE